MTWTTPTNTAQGGGWERGGKHYFPSQGEGEPRLYT